MKFKVQSIWEGSHQSLPAPVNLASAERLIKRMCLLCGWPWVGSTACREPPCPQVWQISLGVEQQWAGAALPDAVARSRDLGQLRLPSRHWNSAFLIFNSSHLESKENSLPWFLHWQKWLPMILGDFEGITFIHQAVSPCLLFFNESQLAPLAFACCFVTQPFLCLPPYPSRNRHPVCLHCLLRNPGWCGRRVYF